jgi:hypothetical protein
VLYEPPSTPPSVVPAPELTASPTPTAAGVQARLTPTRASCRAEGHRQLEQAVEPIEPDSRELQLSARLSTMQDPRMETVIAQWSECMRASGYAYETPLDAEHDPAWAERKPEEPPSTQETNVAVADANCRASVNLTETYDSVQAEYQQQLITEYGEARLTASKQIADKLVQKARGILLEK